MSCILATSITCAHTTAHTTQIQADLRTASNHVDTALDELCSSISNLNYAEYETITACEMRITAAGEVHNAIAMLHDTHALIHNALQKINTPE